MMILLEVNLGIVVFWTAVNKNIMRYGNCPYRPARLIGTALGGGHSE